MTSFSRKNKLRELYGEGFCLSPRVLIKKKLLERIHGLSPYLLLSVSLFSSSVSLIPISLSLTCIHTHTFSFSALSLHFLSLYPFHSFCFKDFLHLFILERGRAGEKQWCERETSISCLSLLHLGSWPTTQACALTGKWTGGDLSVCGMTPTPLSHTSHDYPFMLPSIFGILFTLFFSFSSLFSLMFFTHTLSPNGSSRVINLDRGKQLCFLLTMSWKQVWNWWQWQVCLEESFSLFSMASKPRQRTKSQQSRRNYAGFAKTFCASH